METLYASVKKFKGKKQGSVLTKEAASTHITEGCMGEQATSEFH